MAEAAVPATKTASATHVDFRSATAPRILSGGAHGSSATIGRDVRFLRQAALLLPSAFLLDVLVFLLTHGRNDPGFGTYPFFQPWAGDAAAGAAPEARFLEQSLVFFAPAYVVTLLFILSVAVAERAVFGTTRKSNRSTYRRAFGAAFPALFLGASAAILWLGERAALRQAPGSLVAPLLVAAAPFAAAGLAVIPAAVLAGPLALLWKASAA